jgi:hypothetical protein
MRRGQATNDSITVIIFRSVIIDYGFSVLQIILIMMNIMRRFLKLAPIMTLPIIKFNTLWMTKTELIDIPEFEDIIE